MSVFAARLRDVLQPARGSAAERGPDGLHPQDTEGNGGCSHDASGARDTAADVLGGRWREANGQRFLVVDRTYLPGHRHGHATIADALPPSDGMWPGLCLLAGVDAPAIRGHRLLFVDLETTGLAGGAGSYAFLVGCAWFDGGTFRIRQFFLSTFSAERVLLEAVAEAATAAEAVVTYNGKTFDLPLIDTRFIIHRARTPFESMPHIDMLHPARRLWRGSEDPEGSSGDRFSQASCRLAVLEQTICGHVREGDVPGFEIPGRYFHYVRSGDARPLSAVLEHNRLDLLSLALLTSRAAQLVDDGPAGARTAREAVGLGRLYERVGRVDDARHCFARVDDLAGDAATRAEGLRAFAVLSRRTRRYEDAAAAWRRILELRRCPPQILREATEALAVHHEHRLRDPGAARTFALLGLDHQASTTRRAALQHRLARLNRKLGEPAEDAAPLFQ